MLDTVEPAINPAYARCASDSGRAPNSVRAGRGGAFDSVVACVRLITLLLAGASIAAEFPSRPIRYVIPSAPGGNADIMGRLLAQRLSETIGQPVVIDNRAGASNVIGTEFVVKSPPDGHTLLQVASTAHTTNPSLRKLPYDTLRDLAPVSLIGSTPLLLVAHPSLPVKSAKELVAFAKARPGQLNYSSSGIGTTGHLAGVLLGYMGKVDVVHVPYRGTAQALTDVLSGDLHLALPSMTSGLAFVRSGKLKALGMSGLKRSQLAPNIPTISESGIPGYQASIWNGVLAPSATPKSIIERLNAEIVRILNSPDTRERYASAGADVMPSTPEEFAAFIPSEIQKWATVIKLADIKGE
jgi:tripartite-type tricarboxylate transporter receptor subunit TctC